MATSAGSTIDLRTVTSADGLVLAYRDVGAGPPVLLLHGWPTSSYLWRNVMAPLARSNRVLALDLPGFGGSDKPTAVRYSFDFFERAIDGFLDALEVGEVGVVGHDLGGPIAAHWALQDPTRISGLGLLNTLLYPEFSDAVRDFVTTLRSPADRSRLVSADGLAEVMRLGVVDRSVITEDVIAAVVDPFAAADDRLALAAAGVGLSVRGFAEIAAALRWLRTPMRVVYGEVDRILPDVAETMARLQREVPAAVVTALPGVGHFVQEEVPEVVGELLAEFFVR